MDTFKENEAAWLKDRVFPTNFIPRYSNGYFDLALEIREAIDAILWSIPQFLCLFFPVFLALRKSGNLDVIWITLFGLASFVVLCNHLLFPMLRYYKYGVGHVLTPDGIVEMKGNQKLGRCFPYSMVKTAIMKGRYTYKNNYLEINCIRFKLRFFWEAKDKVAFEHYKSVYELLESKVGMHFPIFNREVQSLLQKERKFCGGYRLAWLATLCFYFYVNLSCYATAHEHPEVIILLFALILGGLYIFSFYYVSKSVMQSRYYIRRLNGIQPGIERKWYWAEHGIGIYVKTNLLLGILSLLHILYLMPRIEAYLIGLGLG